MKVTRRKLLRLFGLAPVAVVASKLNIEPVTKAVSAPKLHVASKGGNNFDSNFTKELCKTFLEKFEAGRVLKKSTRDRLV